MNPLLQLGQYALDTYNQQKGTSYSFAAFPDENTVVIAPPDFSSASSAPTIPEMEATFKNLRNNDLDFQSLDGGKKLKVTGTTASVSKMSIDLVSLLDYSKIQTSFSLGGGLGSVDIGDISPTFTANQIMDFEFSPIVNLRVDLGLEMNYSVFNKEGTLSAKSFGRFVNLIAGQYIEATFPENCSTPVPVEGESKLKGQFKTNVKQEYFESMQVRVGEINIPGVNRTLIDEEIAKKKFDEKTILDHQFTLETNNSIKLPPFILDPENPIITINSVGVEDILNLGGGERAVVYKLGISNDGDVKLSDLQLDFNLAETFQSASHYSVECLHSDDFSLNSNYDGSTIINLFSSGNSLDVGEHGYIEVLIKVKPEISQVTAEGCFGQVNYFSKAKASGVSPIGTLVVNNYNQCIDEITGNDIIASVDLGASVIDDISDFAVYGLDLVKFDKPESLNMGNVGSGGDLIFENTSFQNASKTVIIGDIHAGGQLFIQGESDIEADYVAVAANIKSPSWKSSLTLHGALSENSKCVSIPHLKDFGFPQFESKVKIDLKKGKKINLAPGNYNTVSLSEGSELILTSGIYNIAKWVFLGNNASVKFQLTGGPIQINLGIWQALGRENLQFLIEGEGSVDDVTYNYAGVQKCSFNASKLQGKILAPKAEIEFTNKSILEGTCYAKNVNFKSGSSFKGPEYLEPININSACRDVVIPDEQARLKSGSLVENSGLEKMISIDNQDYRLIIYPNPTKGDITIAGLPEDKISNIRVYSSAGQLMQLLKSSSSELKINISEEPAGVYFVDIEGFRLDPIIKF